MSKFLVSFIFLVTLIIGVIFIDQKTQFFNRAFGVKANLVIDAGSSFDVPGQGWKNLAQGGEEAQRMLLPVINQIKPLNPSYIRIDHLFDYYEVVTRDPSGKLVFNWTKLDLTVSDILSTGARPFLVLSYMPPVLTDGGVTSLPKSWNEWEEVVQRTVEHFSGPLSLGIGNVYYEVWNEPDLFGSFRAGGEKNYFDLYYHTAVAASRVSNVRDFKLGGPATTGLYKNWVEGLVGFALNNSLRLDFISWHRYTKNLSDYEDDYINARSWLEKYPRYKDSELIISETGPNSENDRVYDNSFGAIHALATAALLENDVLKYFNFEIKDGPGPEKYWGRWGILTHEKFGNPEAKPRYQALLFLNKMQGLKVNLAGEGSWVKAFAKDDGKILRIFVVNYDPNGKHLEMVPMKINNLSYSKFLVRRVNFGGGITGAEAIAQNGVWETIEEFKPNTAAIFEIIPQ